MYFETKDRTVYSPVDDRLLALFYTLKDISETLGGSKAFNDLVDIYEFLEDDLKQKKVNGEID